jgi:hypothetical protein
MFAPRARLLHVALVTCGFAASCGSTDGRPPEWAYISPVILQPNCATVSCHSRASAVAGLDFSDPDRGYISLTRLKFQIVDQYATGDDCRRSAGTVVCERSYRPLITPFDPAQSRLVHLLRHRTPPRMPPDRPLFEADIRLIETWILLGARKDAHTDGDAGRAPGTGSRADGAGATGSGG